MFLTRGWLVLLALVASVTTASAQLTIYSWNGTPSNVWTLGDNWQLIEGDSPGNNVPNFATAHARFNNNVNTTVSLTAPISLHTLEYGSSAGAFTIGGTGGSISFANTGSAAIIMNSSAAAQIINTDITLNGALAVTNNSSNSLTLGGVVSGASQTLTLTSDQTTTFSGNVNLGSLVKNGSGMLTLPGSTVAFGTALTLNAGTTNINTTATSTIAGTISGAGNLAQGGAGTTILTGTNSYGTTTISAGTLQVGNGGGTGTLGTGAVTNNATLSFNRTGTLTVANAISGSGAINQVGSGTTLLNGNNTGFTGTVQVLGGVLAVDGSNTFNRLRANQLVTVSAGAFEIRGVNALDSAANSVDVSLTGGALNVVSGGSTAIGATGTSHAHIRNITMNGGTINLNYSSAGGAYNGESFQLNGDINVTGGTNTIQFGGGANTGNAGIGLNGARTFTVAGGATLNVNAEISNNDTAGDSLIKAGTGLLVLNSAINYTGGTTVNAGTLRVSGGSQDRLANNSMVTINNGGTFEFAGTNATGAAANAIDVTINSGGILQSIAGTNHNHLRNININGGTLTTSGTGSYNGENIQLNGTVTVGGSSASTINMSHGLALIGTQTFNVGDSTSSTSADLVLQGGASGNGILQNADSGTGAVIKSGLGTLSLQGTASYTGTTDINAGTFSVNTASGLLNSTGGLVSVNTGGTLAGTDGTVARAITVNSGGIIRGGDVGTIGTLNVTGTTTVLGAASNGGQITVRTNATYSGGDGTSGNPFLLDNNSLLALGSTGTLNLDPNGIGNKFRFLIENDEALAQFTTYRLVVATASVDTQFQRSGSGTNPFTSADFEVWGATSANPFTENLVLTRTGNSLMLTFTTVPEPSLMLGLGAGVLALGAFLRKRFA